LLWKDVAADNMQSGKKTDEATATEAPSYTKDDWPSVPDVNIRFNSHSKHQIMYGSYN